MWSYSRICNRVLCIDYSFPTRAVSQTLSHIHFMCLHPVVTGVADNPNNSIVIKNQKPKTWTGRTFDIGIYKSGRLLVVQKGVRIMDQVDFMLQSKLYFAVARNMHVGKVFTSMEISSKMTMFDLSQYPNGIEVTLTQTPGGGEYSFSAASLI